MIWFFWFFWFLLSILPIWGNILWDMEGNLLLQLSTVRRKGGLHCTQSMHLAPNKLVTPGQKELNYIYKGMKYGMFLLIQVHLFICPLGKSMFQLTAGSFSRAPPTYRCIDHALQCHRRPVGRCPDGGGATLPLREFPFETSRGVEVSFPQWGQIGFDQFILRLQALL